MKVEIIKARGKIEKSDVSNQVNSSLSSAGDMFITPPTDLRGYKRLVNNSTILPQCIRAYKNNIAGFGIGIRYKEDVPETSEMKAEWDRITEIVELLNMDKNTKEVFEDIIEAREIYGIAYLEVIRNLKGEVTTIEFIRHTPTIQKTNPLDPYIDVEYLYKSRVEKRRKRFCKYRQQYAGNTVYFKEIGDKRIMDKNTGEYRDGVALAGQATEILEFAIGVEPYGEARWLGQVLSVDGSRKAESLNNRYFEEGRHTPLMIMINGGTLTDDSFTKLQTYMDDIKGENGQHAFILLETENLGGGTVLDDEKSPKVEIHNLASMLQKDELFQDYIDNNRRKAQSAFQLPDLYVGYTTDFNRATAQLAQEVTEKQVFHPERQRFAWAINNKLLADYRFKYVEVFLKTPDISNPDDIMKILNVTERAGGLTPNKAKELTYKAFGEVSENYKGDWGDIPLAYASLSPAGQLDQQIQKAAARDDVEITAVLKEIRKLLIAGGGKEDV